MTGRRRTTFALDGNIVVGRGWQLYDQLKEAGVKPTYSASAGGWMFDRRRLPDVLAYLDSRNIPVVVEDPDQFELDPFGGDAA